MNSLSGFGAVVKFDGALGGVCKNPTKIQLKRKLATLIASGFLSWALLGVAQPVQAGERITRADIYSVLGLTQPAAPPAQADATVAALANFAQRIAGEQPKPLGVKEANTPDRQLDDDAVAALREFAQRVGAVQPASLKGQPKFAATDNEAESLFDFLQQKSGAGASPDGGKPKAAKGKASKSAPVDATYVGEKVCMTCHASHAAEFGKTLMGKLAKTQPGKFACENCHGPGSAHAKAGGGRGVGGILSFGETDPRSVEERNGVCLNCHLKGDRINWAGSTHDERGVACTNCHTIMKNVSAAKQLKTKFQADTCYQCHQNKRAQSWRSAHMPVREGKMTCTNCHNPHGSFSEHNLKEATVNDTCYKCHAEKRGPFLWEHPPVRESCLNCHDPHGSNNDFLLKISRPRLCQQCHAGGQHNSNPRNPQSTLYAQGRECQNCHSNHHGSNNPAGPRFMR
jgi:DmsE family decaheme c-type cytochrome